MTVWAALLSAFSALIVSAVPVWATENDSTVWLPDAPASEDAQPGESVSADPPPDLKEESRARSVAFRRGLTAYREGRLHESVRQFEEHLTEHPNDPNGWYNLGSVYARAHPDGGNSSWAWTRALRAAPRDRDTRLKLERADLEEAFLVRALPTVPVSENEALLVAAFFFLVAAVGGVIYLFPGGLGARHRPGDLSIPFPRERSRWWRPLRRSGRDVATVCAVLALLSLFPWLQLRMSRNLGLILPPAVALLEAPMLRSPATGMLQAKTGIRVTDRHGAWVRVSTLAGREGWVQGEAIGPLSDRTPPFPNPTIIGAP